MDEQLSRFGHGQSVVAGLFLIGFYHYIFRFMTCTSGCNYSLCTPDYGCGRHPKHVESLAVKQIKTASNFISLVL